MTISHLYFDVQSSELLLIFILCWWPCCLIYWSNQKKTSTTIYIYLTFSTCTHIVCLATCHHRWTFYVPNPSICVQGSIPFQLLRDIDPIIFLFCLLSFQAAYNLTHFIKPFLDLISLASYCFIFTLLWSKTPRLILFILIASDFSPLTFSPKLTPARLPPHHYIKTVIKVTKDLHAAESHAQFSVSFWLTYQQHLMQLIILFDLKCSPFHPPTLILFPLVSLRCLTRNVILTLPIQLLFGISG